jgi:hypothetical protein
LSLQLLLDRLGDFTSAVTSCDLGHIKYSLDTIIDYDRHFTVDETITYPNTSGQALDSLTLPWQPIWPNCFHWKIFWWMEYKYQAMPLMPID